MSEAVRQVRARYEGNVQGVGFRYTVRGIAQRLGVAGGVENMPDGSVHMVAEGPEGALRQLLLNVRISRVGEHVESERTEWGEAQGLSGFYYR